MKHIRYAGILYPDGSVTLFWIWKGEARNYTYGPESMDLNIHSDDINWLVDIADNRG